MPFVQAQRLILQPLAAAAALLLAGVAQAQSLQELYDAARGYDATYLASKASADAAAARAAQAEALLKPSLGLSASATQARQDPPGGSAINARTLTAGLQGRYSVYNAANVPTIDKARRGLAVAQADLESAEQDLIVRLATAYFDVLAAKDALTTSQANKAGISEQLASAKRNFEVGTATITDTREAQARFDLVTAQEIQAENDLRVRKLALDTLTGLTGSSPVPLAAPLDVPAPEPASPEAWVSQGEAASPIIQQARTTLDIAEWEIEKAKAGHKPTVDLTASYGIQRNLNGSATTLVDSRSNVGQLGVTFNLPLFAGFSTQNRIRETLSLEERARADLEAARRNVAQATRTAYFGVISGQGQVRALEAAEASSQLALDANRLGYQVGVRINIDVLNAQSQLFQTKRDLAQARYNVLLGQLRLRQANGTLVPEDLARLNALVAR